MTQAVVENFYGIIVSSFLRTKDIGGPIGSVERIANIAGNCKPAIGE